MDKRHWPALLAAALVILAACGRDDASETIGGEISEDGSAITAADADSQIVDEGDEAPIDGGDAGSTVAVSVDLPRGVELGGTAIIALEDVSLADAASTEIARVELTIAELVALDNEVEIVLPLPLDGSIDVTATVHLDVDESGGFSPGDWISPEIVPVTSTSSAVTVSVVQI